MLNSGPSDFFVTMSTKTRHLKQKLCVCMRVSFIYIYMGTQSSYQLGCLSRQTVSS